tara:strand:- start:469 stop:1242 length:774 start_codon:yes stop_codon:yes gene_type:complete
MVTKVLFELDEERAVRPTLGLVVLQADETIEDEFRAYLQGCDVVLHHTRVPSGEEVTHESLSAMEHQLEAAIRLFPTNTVFDVIGYACTSASSVIGETKVSSLINRVYPEAVTTNPATAIKAAMASLGVAHPALLAPYTPELASGIASMLEAGGFQVSALLTFDEEVEEKVARISPNSILDGVISVGRDQACDGVFVSCTNLRCAKIISEAEATLGKPVFSSNQTLLWHMLQLAGVSSDGIAKDRLCCQKLWNCRVN